MIRPLLLSIALATLSVCAFGQYNPNQVRKVNSLPATCTVGTTTPVVYGAVVYTCTATNTWTANQTPGQLPTSTYAGLPTCSSGNDGQLVRVTDANRDVYSCNGSTGAWGSRNGNIYNVADFAGSSLTARITAAITAMPSTGGTLDLRQYTGAQSLNSFTITKPIVVLIGGATYTVNSGQTITVNTYNCHIIGIDRRVSKIVASSSTPLFTYSGTYSYGAELEWSELWLDGGSVAGSRAIHVPNINAGVTELQAAKNTIHNCTFTNFGNYAIYLGQSVYWNTIENNVFLNCNGSAYIGPDADTAILNNIITSSGSNPGLSLVGSYCQVIHNEIGVDGSGTWGTPAEDIRITKNTSLGDQVAGIFNIALNRFNDESEVNSRYKIRIVGETASDVTAGVTISDNWFGGIYGQTAISQEMFLLEYNFHDNYFIGFTTIVSETQDMTSAVPGYHGNSLWHDNHVAAPQGSSYENVVLFTRGGIDFSVIRGDRSGSIGETDTQPVTIESMEVRNRVPSSIDLTNGTYWTLNTATRAGGVTDPYGGTNATTVTTTGGNNSESIYATISLTGAVNAQGVAASGYNGRMYLYFWAKAVSGAPSIRVGIYNNANSNFVRFNQFDISTSWRLYKMVIAGVNPAQTHRLFFYPGGYKTEVSAVSIAFPTISDVDKYFHYPTSGAASSDSVLGSYFAKGLFAKYLVLSNVAVTASSGGTTSLDFSLGNVRTVTMPAGNTTLTATNVPVGPVWISITQDSTGGRTVTWNSLFLFASGTKPTLTTAANATDQFQFICNGTTCTLQSAVYNAQ